MRNHTAYHLYGTQYELTVSTVPFAQEH